MEKVRGNKNKDLTMKTHEFSVCTLMLSFFEEMMNCEFVACDMNMMKNDFLQFSWKRQLVSKTIYL